MPRTAIAVTTVTRSGVVPPSATAGDAANDHEIAANDGKIWLEAKNTHGSLAQDVTIVTPGTIDTPALAIADLVVNLAAGVIKLIGPFPTSYYNQGGADAGKIFINVGENTWEFRAYKLTTT